MVEEAYGSKTHVDNDQHVLSKNEAYKDWLGGVADAAERRFLEIKIEDNLRERRLISAGNILQKERAERENGVNQLKQAAVEAREVETEERIKEIRKRLSLTLKEGIPISEEAKELLKARAEKRAQFAANEPGDRQHTLLENFRARFDAFIKQDKNKNGVRSDAKVTIMARGGFDKRLQGRSTVLEKMVNIQVGLFNRLDRWNWFTTPIKQESITSPKKIPIEQYMDAPWRKYAELELSGGTPELNRRSKFSTVAYVETDRPAKQVLRELSTNLTELMESGVVFENPKGEKIQVPLRYKSNEKGIPQPSNERVSCHFIEEGKSYNGETIAIMAIDRRKPLYKNADHRNQESHQKYLNKAYQHPAPVVLFVEKFAPAGKDQSKHRYAVTMVTNHIVMDGTPAVEMIKKLTQGYTPIPQENSKDSGYSSKGISFEYDNKTGVHEITFSIPVQGIIKLRELLVAAAERDKLVDSRGAVIKHRLDSKKKVPGLGVLATAITGRIMQIAAIDTGLLSKEDAAHFGTLKFDKRMAYQLAEINIGDVLPQNLDISKWFEINADGELVIPQGENAVNSMIQVGEEYRQSTGRDATVLVQKAAHLRKWVQRLNIFASNTIFRKQKRATIGALMMSNVKSPSHIHAIPAITKAQVAGCSISALENDTFTAVMKVAAKKDKAVAFVDRFNKLVRMWEAGSDLDPEKVGRLETTLIGELDQVFINPLPRQSFQDKLNIITQNS